MVQARRNTWAQKFIRAVVLLAQFGETTTCPRVGGRLIDNRAKHLLAAVLHAIQYDRGTSWAFGRAAQHHRTARTAAPLPAANHTPAGAQPCRNLLEAQPDQRRRRRSNSTRGTRIATSEAENGAASAAASTARYSGLRQRHRHAPSPISTNGSASTER